MSELMTRAAMAAVITAGGSVAHDNRLYTRVEDLPDEVELAQGDDVRKAAALDAVDDQLAKLTAQRTKLVTEAETIASKKGKRAAPDGGATQTSVPPADPSAPSAQGAASTGDTQEQE